MITTTDQLNSACSCENFLGTFALDQLPSHYTKGSKFIVNTDTSNLPGRHWIAVVGNHLFEPTGFYYPSMLVKHMYELYDELTFNYDAYQNPMENTCGFFCMYYLHYLTDDLLPYAFDYNLRIVYPMFYSCTRHVPFHYTPTV